MQIGLDDVTPKELKYTIARKLNLVIRSVNNDTDDEMIQLIRNILELCR